MFMRARPYLLLALVALAWGCNWPITRIGLDYLPPYTYAALRACIGLAALLPIALRHGLRLPPREDLPIVLSVGLGQIGAGIVLMNLALAVVAPGRSAILVYTMPLWIALMQLDSLLSSGGVARQLSGLGLGLAGILVLINPLAIDWGSSGQLIGATELLLSSVIWAGTTIHIRNHHWHATPMELEPWQLLIALLPMLLAAPFLDAGRSIDIEPISILCIFYSGVVATALGYWLSQSISRALSPLATTMGFLAVPVVGLISSFLLVGEPLSLLDLAGVALTFAGIMAVSTQSSEVAEEIEIAESGPPEETTDAG